MMLILGAEKGGGLAKNWCWGWSLEEVFFVELSAYRQSTFPPRASYANHKKHEQSDCDKKAHEKIQFRGIGFKYHYLSIALQL